MNVIKDVAPTAANLQPVRLLVVQEKEGLDKISKAANIYSAPLAIIVCIDCRNMYSSGYQCGKLVDLLFCWTKSYVS